MSAVRPGTPGATRTCPHCKATILESSVVCPGCKHHLRFDPAIAGGVRKRANPFQVEGTLRQPPTGPVLEYSMVVAIRNERGEEIARHIVGVGALYPEEIRSFSVSVEVTEATGAKARRR